MKLICNKETETSRDPGYLHPIIKKRPVRREARTWAAAESAGLSEGEKGCRVRPDVSPTGPSFRGRGGAAGAIRAAGAGAAASRGAGPLGWEPVS